MIFQVLVVVLAEVAGSAFGQDQRQYWPPVASCGIDPGVGYPVPSFPESASCTCSFQPLRLATASPGIQATYPVYQGWWAYLTEPLEPGGWQGAQPEAGPNSASFEDNNSNTNERVPPEQSDMRRPIYTEMASSRDASDHQSSVSKGADPAQQNAKESKPTIYLIALKDHSIVRAIGLWEEGSVVYYVSIEYALNQVSDVRVDWVQSRQLNRERGIELKVANAN